MIVDQAVYRDGKRQPCADLSDELDKLADVPDGFLWIGLKDPTDAEFDLVKDELGLHPLAIEDAVKGNQRAKMEIYDGSLFVVLKPLRYIEETSQVETGEVMLFVGQHFVVTVRRGEASPLSEVRRRLELNAGNLAYGPAAVLHAVMDDVVDQYGQIDQEIAKDLEEMEESVFAGDVEVEEAALGDAKPPPAEHASSRRPGRPTDLPAQARGAGDAPGRGAVEGRHARLHQAQTPNVPEQARPFFRDVADHLLRVSDHIESYDRLLSDILSAHLTRVSVQQNDDMRRISAWAAIGVAATLIAGIYGMNFHHMPELKWTFGYPMALGLMVVVAGVLYRQFKKSGWL